ncbi:MAG: PEP/pyruvate-binding domain-containing protein [Candidatus Hodarchaeales archaeon]|jgi:pyruvate,water dikinase
MYESQPILKLSDVDYARTDTFGDRACSLSRLMAKGYHIPKGVVVSTKVFKRFLNTAPGTKRIDHLMNQVSPATITETAQEIQDLINFSPVPMQMANSIAEAITDLLDESKTPNLIVRTSANVEGSSRHVCSGRGVFFNMSDVTSIIRVVKNCWASAYTEDVLKDLIQAGLPPDSVWVAVIIEEMMEAKVSGELIVEKSEGNNQVVTRANWGSLVYQSEEGIYCDHILIDGSENKIGEPIETFNAYKNKISMISKEDSQPRIIKNDPNKRNALSLNPEQISTLKQLAKKIHDDFEVGYLIDFMFDKDDTLWLLDAVPLTTHKYLRKIGASP